MSDAAGSRPAGKPRRVRPGVGGPGPRRAARRRPGGRRPRGRRPRRAVAGDDGRGRGGHSQPGTVRPGAPVPGRPESPGYPPGGPDGRPRPSRRRPWCSAAGPARRSHGRPRAVPVTPRVVAVARVPSPHPATSRRCPAGPGQPPGPAGPGLGSPGTRVRQRAAVTGAVGPSRIRWHGGPSYAGSPVGAGRSRSRMPPGSVPTRGRGDPAYPRPACPLPA